MEAQAAPLADTREVGLDETQVGGGEEEGEPSVSSKTIKASSETDKDLNMMFGAAEAQWILGVLDDAINKMTLISFLTPEILNDRIMKTVDSEVQAALTEHFEVEGQYSQLLEEITKTGGDAADDKMFRELDLCLADSTRTVGRLLKGNPGLVRRLREIAPRRAPHSLEFINTYTRLRKLVHQKLRMSAEEERAVREQLERLQEEEEEDAKRFLELTEGLAVERSEHKATIEAKDRKVHRLRTQLETLALKTQEERQSFEQQMADDHAASEKLYQETMSQLTTTSAAAEKSFEDQSSANWDNEMKQHRIKYHASHAVEKLIKKYDADMIEKHTELTDLQKVYTEEHAELTELESYFAEVEAEIARQEEEIKMLTKARNQELAVERKRHQAAVLMQSLFRGFHSRIIAEHKKAAKASKEASKAKKR